MAKNLVIVESPAKAKTLGKYLGRNYTVKASVGHVVDLPKSKLGVDIANDFKPDYAVIHGKSKIIDELKKAAKGKDNIYLAPDPDREGEAIAFHVKELLLDSLSKKKNKTTKISEGKLTDKQDSKFYRITFHEITKKVRTPLGMHAHNDSECAVANSVIAVESGASQVQGTINGLGERCGNANLCSVIPNLQVKLGMKCISADQLRRLREVARFVNEIANIRHFKREPFVGDSAFAHKAGIHVSAIRKRPETYEHVRPELVGNSQRVLISDLAGKSNILRKAEEFGIRLDADSPQIQDIVTTLKNLENEGFQFEAAEASFELLMKKSLGLHKRFFDLIGFRIIVDKRREGEEAMSEATIMVKVGGRVEHTAATGEGPVNAIDNALRKALDKFYPSLKDVKLHDYKVRVLTAGKGTSAKVRVLVESGDDEERWGTVGVSENIIEASYQALVDSIEYKLLKEETA